MRATVAKQQQQIDAQRRALKDQLSLAEAQAERNRELMLAVKEKQAALAARERSGSADEVAAVQLQIAVYPCQGTKPPLRSGLLPWSCTAANLTSRVIGR